MTDIQLDCFLVTCSTLNFTRTAEKMNYAPQAVSKMIVSLEEELGVPLFERNGRTLSLSRAGAYYMDLLSRDKGKKARTMGEIYGWYRWLSSHFRLGISEWVDPIGGELADVLASFRRANPGLVFSAEANDNETLLQKLAAGDLDAVIMPSAYAYPSQAFGATPIAREWQCLVVPDSLCGADPDVALDPECWGTTYVQRPARNWGNSEFTRIVRRNLSEQGIFPKEVRMMPTVMSINTALMIMDCVTIADRRFGHVIRLPKVRYFDLPEPRQEALLYCNWSFRNENPRVLEFIRFAQQALGDCSPEWEAQLPTSETPNI